VKPEAGLATLREALALVRRDGDPAVAA
jgi:hypothetical protein